MNILGISAYYHDAAAALILDGKIVAAAQEERFSRKKHDPSFPAGAAAYCLNRTGCRIEELDAVAFYDKPFLKFERILETYYRFAPRGFRSFTKSMPVWIKEKIFHRKMILDALAGIERFDRKRLKLLFPEHHLSHAASAFFSSPFMEAGILTVDGVGEWATCTISRGTGNNIEILRELVFPDSVGLLYSAFTHYLGFRVNSGEYKLMCLAPYGHPDSERTHDFKEKIESCLVDINEDGSVRLNQEYFEYATGLRMNNYARWFRLFGVKRRIPGDPIRQEHCDLAFAAQQVTEKIILRLARETQRLSGSGNLCMAGGVALNCVANGKVRDTGSFNGIYIQPAAGDAGGAVGAAMAVHHIYFGKDRLPGKGDRMQYALLGPAYSDSEIRMFLNRKKATFEYLDESDLYERVAKLIRDGAVIGWFQGRMEFGPRALGNRSILADPAHPGMQEKLNRKIKFRESFRPFAPAILMEDLASYFNCSEESPYMLMVDRLKEGLREELPPDYPDLPPDRKLSVLRSKLQAVIHVDFSARIQTVTPESNARFYKLVRAFRKLSGYGVLINTSFNIRGEPIVNSPDDAYRCFLSTGIDYLVLGNHLCSKDKAGPARDPAYIGKYANND